MSQEVVSVRNLEKSFKGFQAVKDVSFTVKKNDVFGFLGPNGAGKSTSLRCMLSLIKEDAGEIKLFGQTMSGNRNKILSRIGSIIEKPDFYKYLSAYKNLELLARISGARVSKSELYDILEFVGLQGREKHRFRTFSHGMKQRLGIAQALMHNPELIILDEPTTGLDPQGIVDIRNLILKLSKEQGKTGGTRDKSAGEEPSAAGTEISAVAVAELGGSTMEAVVAKTWKEDYLFQLRFAFFAPPQNENRKN